MARLITAVLGVGGTVTGAVWTILTALTDPSFLIANTGLSFGVVTLGTELGRNLGPTWVPWKAIALGATAALFVFTLAKIYQKRRQSNT